MANRTYEEVLKFVIKAGGDEELVGLVREMTQLGDAGEAAQRKVAGLLEDLGTAKGLERTAERFRTTGAEVVSLAQRYGQAKGKVAELAAAMADVEKPTTRQEAAFARAKAALEKTGGELTAARRRWADLKTELDQSGVSANTYAGIQARVADRQRAAADALRAYASEALTGRRAEAEHAASSSLLAKGLGAVGLEATDGAAAIAGLATSIASIAAASAAAVAGLAAVGGVTLLKGAIQSATTFEDALVQVQAVTGASTEQLARMKDAAEGAASTTRFTALEAAQALGELARASGDADKAIAALPATLDLAQGAGLDVANAANIVSTTLTQFNLGMGQAAHVADLFAKEANSTSDTVERVGNAMSYAAPLAAQLGMSIEETATLLAVLAKNGIMGERAGTALRNAFSQMLNPMSGFSKTLREAGVESHNFAEVAKILAGNSELAQRALLELDAEARPAISTLVSDGGEQLEKMTTAMAEAGGEAARMAAQMGNSTTAAAEQVGKSLDQIRRDMVDPLLEPLRQELLKLTEDLIRFSKTPEFDQIKTAFLEMMTTGLEAMRVFAKEVDWDKLLDGVVKFATMSANHLETLLPVVDSVAHAINALFQTVSLSMNSVQAVLSGVAASITGTLAILAQAFDTLTGPQRRLLEFLGIIEKGELDFSGFAERMAATSQAFTAEMRGHFDGAVDAAKALDGEVSEAADHAAKATRGYGQEAAKATPAVAALGEASKDAAPAVTEVGDAAKESADKTSRAAGKISLSAEQIRNAYADLGVKSQAELDRAAGAAKRSFDVIREAAGQGKASVEDVRRAFGAYAAAARAAAADSDDVTKARVADELKLQAALTGSKEKFDDLGSAARDANGAIRSVGSAATAFSQAEDGARSAGAAVGELGEFFSYASKFMGTASHQGQAFALSMYEVSEAAQKAYVGTNWLAGTGLWAREVNRVTDAVNAQGEALRRQLSELEKANEQYDELAQRRSELRSQYNLLGDGEINRLLAAEQQLEANRKRDADRQQRQAEELARSAQQAAGSRQAPAGPARPTGAANAATPTNLPSFGTIRLELPDGTSGQIVTDAQGADLLRHLMDLLRVSKTNGPRPRR